MSLKMATAIGKSDENVTELGKRIVREAIAGLEGQKPGLAIVMSSAKYDLKKLLEVIREELKGVPLIGETAAGEFTEKEVLTGSVALTLFSKCDEYDFHVGIAQNLKENPVECIKKVVAGMPAKNKELPNRSAILMIDGLVGYGEEAAMTAISLLGSEVNLAGGAAGDDLAMKETFVFCNDEISSNAAVLCIIDSKNPVGVSSKHSYSAISEELTTTKVKDNVLFEVDGKPAWEVWKEQIREKAKEIGVDVDNPKDAVEQSLTLLMFEMGLPTTTDYKVRAPMFLGENGSIIFTCTIPEGSKFKIMTTTQPELIASAKEGAQLAMDKMKGKKIAGGLVFDCGCRYLLMQEKFADGVRAITDTIGKVPMMGIETYGEICRPVGQFSGFHNTTSVIMLFPEE